MKIYLITYITRLGREVKMYAKETDIIYDIQTTTKLGWVVKTLKEVNL